MKKLLAIVLLAVSTNAMAAMWTLIDSDYVGGGWVCTYKLEGSNYQTSIFSNSYCQQFIFN